MFIIQNNENPRFIQPFLDRDMFVQYDPTVPNPITLPVTTSSEPDGAFIMNNARGVPDEKAHGVADKKAKCCCILL